MCHDDNVRRRTQRRRQRRKRKSNKPEQILNDLYMFVLSVLQAATAAAQES